MSEKKNRKFGDITSEYNHFEPLNIKYEDENTLRAERESLRSKLKAKTEQLDKAVRIAEEIQKGCDGAVKDMPFIYVHVLSGIHNGLSDLLQSIKDVE